MKRLCWYQLLLLEIARLMMKLLTMMLQQMINDRLYRLVLIVVGWLDQLAIIVDGWWHSYGR